jgi:hypothetical protein
MDATKILTDIKALLKINLNADPAPDPTPDPVPDPTPTPDPVTDLAPVINFSEELEKIKTELKAEYDAQVVKLQAEHAAAIEGFTKQVETFQTATTQLIGLCEELAKEPTAEPTERKKDGFNAIKLKNEAGVSKFAAAFDKVRQEAGLVSQN